MNELNDFLDTGEDVELFPEENETENKEVKKNISMNSFSVPSVFSEEEVKTAVETVKNNRAEQINNFLQSLLQQEMDNYRAQHGYDMDGKTKRRTRKIIEKLYKKGKIKFQPFSDFNK